MELSQTRSRKLGALLFTPVFACAVLGVVLRLAVFWAARDETFFYAHVQDSALYHELAQRLMVEGVPLSEPFFVAPLYAFFLAEIEVAFFCRYFRLCKAIATAWFLRHLRLLAATAPGLSRWYLRRCAATAPGLSRRHLRL